MVACTPLRATLMVEACLRRHTGMWPSGRRRGAPRWPFCAACPLGALHLRRAPWYRAPPPSQPAEVLSPVQLAARDRWRRSFLRVPPVLGPDDVDPLRVASDMSPEDRATGWASVAAPAPATA
jgi:hypothetical protein